MDALSLAGLVGLGALHGINPGMGWPFAVAKGMQERQRRAVWRAVAPLAAGHAIGIGATLAVASFAGLVLAPDRLRWLVAGLLVVMGARHLSRPTHLSAGGMRVGAGRIALWSCLMSLAHGAGLMVVPLVLAGGAATAGHAHHASLAGTLERPLVATLAHAAGYLAVTTLVAILVFEKLGVALLRTWWFNLDALWAVALLVTAVVMLA